VLGSVRICVGWEVTVHVVVVVPFGYCSCCAYGFGFMAVWVCMARIWGCLGVMLLEISLCVHSVHLSFLWFDSVERERNCGLGFVM